jgi:hypothetical protein
MAKKKVTRPVESGFLSGAFTRFLTGESEPPNVTPAFDQKSAERYFLPAKVKRQEAKLESLAAEIKRLKETVRRRNKPSCRLWGIVASVKERMPTKASDHKWIAQRVDAILEKAKPPEELKDVCLKSWMMVDKPPRSLSDALKHQVLRPRVKSFISKARL